MKNIYKLVFTAMALLAANGLSAQVNGTATAPEVSTLANPIYYYIESAANGTVTTSGQTLNYLGKVIFPVTASSKIKINDMPANKDDAMWAIVNDGGINRLYNKGKGWYMSLSHTAVATATAAFNFTLIEGTTNKYTMVNDNATGSVTLAWTNNNLDRWNNNQGDNSLTAWYFLLPNTGIELAITNATNVHSSAMVGTQPGQYTADAKNALQAAINTATDVKVSATATEEDKNAATVALNQAVNTFTSSKVALNTAGTKWYLVKGQRGSVADALYAESQGNGNQVLNKAKQFENKQAWKIVANGNGYAIQNRADNTYFGTTIANPTNIPSITAIPSSKPIMFNYCGTSATDHINQFLVENKSVSVKGQATSPSFRLHAGAAGNNWGLMNYTGGMFDNTRFEFIEVPVTADAANSPADGNIGGGSTITLTSAASEATIYYTTDGSEPTTSTATNVLSGGSITAPTSGTLVVKTLAVAPAHFPSEVVTSTYTIMTTGANTAYGTKYNVKVNNGTITVDGVAEFDVYTVAGQKVNAKATQKAGVYVVKVKDFTQKIMVK